MEILIKQVTHAQEKLRRKHWWKLWEKSEYREFDSQKAEIGIKIPISDVKYPERLPSDLTWENGESGFISIKFPGLYWIYKGKIMDKSDVKLILGLFKVVKDVLGITDQQKLEEKIHEVYN
jgi:hypothetical protein